MKKCIFFVLILSIISISSFAQGWTWGREIWGLANGYTVKTDKCNNVFVAGIWKNDSLNIGGDIYHNDYTGVNVYDCYIAKYDSAGNVLWSDASIIGQALPYSIAVDSIGNSYLFGCFWTDSVMFGSHLLINPYKDSCLFPCSWGMGCYFIIKYSPSGNIIWASTGDNIVGAGEIVIDDANNIYITSNYWNTTMKIGSDTLHNTSYRKGDIFLAKYDSAGTPIWAKNFGGTSDDNASGLCYANGRLYMSGSFQSPTISFGSTTLTFNSSVPTWGFGDAYLVQLDTAGNPLWAKCSVGSAISHTVAVDMAGGVYIGGQVYDTSYVAFGVDTLSDSCLKWAGFLTKYDTNGSVEWVNGIFRLRNTITTGGTFHPNQLWGIVTDKCNNVWVTGALSPDTLGVRIDTGVILHPAGSWNPLYFIGYNANGTPIQFLSTASGSDNGGKVGITCDRSGNIYLTSNLYNSSMIFGPDTLLLYGGGPMFLAKYNPGLGCSSPVGSCAATEGVNNTTENMGEIKLIPNPNSGDFILSGAFKNVENQEASIQIVNIIGQTVFQKSIKIERGAINEVITLPGSLSGGVYILNLQSKSLNKHLHLQLER